MITTLLIGLGNIAQLYDYNFSSDQFNLTHAQALTKDKRFDLVAGLDINSSLRKKFEAKFDRPTFTQLSEFQNLKNPELVIIATPAETHSEIIFDVLKRVKPRAILCEKPLSFNLEQSESIVRKCEEFGVELYINFIRRTDPAVFELKSIIDQNESPNLFSGFCWYSRGLYNTGSHFADLFQFLFGQPKAWSLRNKPKQNLPHYDSQIDFNLSFNSGDIEFKSVPHDNLFYNRFELILQNVVVSYQQNGDMYLSQIEGNTQKFDRYTVNNKSVLISADMDNYQANIYDAAFDAINGQENQLATGKDALIIARIFDDLINGE